jgi:hypothetical protein
MLSLLRFTRSLRWCGGTMLDVHSLRPGLTGRIWCWRGRIFIGKNYWTTGRELQGWSRFAESRRGAMHDGLRHSRGEIRARLRHLVPFSRWTGRRTRCTCTSAATSKHATTKGLDTAACNAPRISKTATALNKPTSSHWREERGGWSSVSVTPLKGDRSRAPDWFGERLFHPQVALTD